jgi:aminoglycoside phosphotransferase (APT) family kinase protein
VDVLPAVSREQAGRLVQAIRPDLRVVRVWPFAGAVSSQITGIEVEAADGARRTLVLRQYRTVNPEVVPHLADTEYRLLRLLSAAGLPVPGPRLADDSRAVVPGPCVVMEYIDGERVHEPADLPSFPHQLSAALAAVHDCGLARADLSFLPYAGDQVLEELRTDPHTAGDAVPETAICSALRASWPPEQASEPVLLHDDYWPGNVLWRDGRRDHRLGRGRVRRSDGRPG